MAEERVKRMGKKKKKRRWIKWAVLAVVFLLIAALAGYIISIFKDYNYHPLDTSDLGISQDENLVSDDGSSDIVNIALFGVDQRNNQEQVRSDSIMILSVDKKHNKIKIISLMRDTYVEIEGYGKTKLTHAYYYGGPQLAVKTINQNFGTNITEFATVNFQQMAAIIDAVGGVEIDISEAERKNANGTQAVAYARIRYVGNADFDRTERQRKVMRQLFDKALDMNPLQYPEFARKLLPGVKTSLDFNDIMGLSGILLRGDITMEEMRIPRNEHLIGSGSITDAGGGACLNVDLEAAAETIRAFIYDDVNPDRSDEESDSSSE